MATVVDGLRVEVGLGSTPATPLASIAWTDVTSDVLLPRGVTFNRGRGSQEDGATPGRLTLTLNNGQATGKSVGRWTRGGSNCTAGWSLRVPIRVLYSAPINGSFESDASGWGALAACTIARSTAQSYSGTASLALTATSAATMSVRSSQGVNGTPVRASQAYTARARIRATAASRTGYVSVAWYSAAGTFISTSAGTPAALTSGAWVEVTTAVTAPSTAAYAAVLVYVSTPAVSEVAYVDVAALDLALWLGYVDAARPTWENGVRPVVEVSATDRLARFQQRKLTSLATGEVLYDDPAAYFPLSESATSATVGDASGNQRGTLGLITCGSPTNATFEMGSAEVPGGDGITSAGFAPDNDRNGYALAGDLAGMPSAYYGISCLVRMTQAPSGSDITLVQLASATSFSPLRIRLLDGGVPAAHSGTGLSLVQASAALPLNEWVALFAWTDASGIYLRVASTNYATAVAPSQFTPTRVFVGGTNKPVDSAYHHAFAGNIANVAVWSTVPGSTRRTEHGKAGDGFAGDTAVERFQRVCRVAGLAAADYGTTSSSLTVPPGNSTPAMGEQPTDGRPFLDAVQECADVERGVAFMGGDGVLTLQRGAFRFNQAVALTLAPRDVDASTGIDDDLDRLVNDVTVRRVGGADQRVVNQASVDAYDPHNETIDIYTSDDGQALAVAAWKVADRGTPQPRVDSVAVDLVPKAATVSAASLLTVPQSGRVQLTPMPTPDSPSSTVDLLADGFTDRVSESSWLRTMTTSSATNYSNVWLWDTATEKFDTGGVLY